MVSVRTVPARGGRSCEHFGGYKTINRIPLETVIWIQDTFDNNLEINPSNATFIQSTRTQRFFEKHLNLVMLVFI